MIFSRKYNDRLKVNRFSISKIHFNSRLILIFLLGAFLLNTNSSYLFAQKSKKNKARINVQYVKIMDGEIYFDIKATSRVDKKNVQIPNIEINISNKLEEESIDLGKSTTNNIGESRFKLKNLNQIRADSSNTYNLLFSFKGNDSFKKAKKSISFKDVELTAKIISKDSLNFISATLVDPLSGEPIVDEVLTVQVQRLFKPLRIGKEFNNTDEEGSIEVPIESGIPGINGNLSIEVVLNESDDYGTVKVVTSGPLGVPIVDESTFDQRTMWSPRNKTPLFMLIFPNLLIITIWGFIIYLIINLFKISKS